MDQVLLLMWVWNDDVVLLRTTSKLLTSAEGETKKPSVMMERSGCLLSMDFVEMGTTSGLSLLSLMKLEVNQNLKSELGVVHITVEMGVTFPGISVQVIDE